MIAVMIGFTPADIATGIAMTGTIARDGMAPGPTAQESEQVHDERDQRLVRSDKRYHFFCEKLQSSVFVDDGKQICDADHLHTEGGTESLDDVSGLDPVDETEDHGEADT